MSCTYIWSTCYLETEESVYYKYKVVVTLVLYSLLQGKAVFGVPLEVAVKQSRFPDGVELPRVFREGIVYIEENCKMMRKDWVDF